MSRAPSLHAPRVAIIDDEEDVLTFVRIALEDAGFTVEALDRPTEALATLEAFRPHVILLDLLMPEQMGVSLYTELRASPVLRDVPVIIVSGLNARDTLQEASAATGAGPPAGYLEKPVDAAALLDAVRRALSHSGRGTP